MERPLSILIIGHDAAEGAALANQITGYEELRVAGIAGDQPTALRLLSDRGPDVVVIDLGQHLMDGVSLLREMRRQDLPARPYVLVTADNPGPVVYELALDYGADLILEKRRQGYSPRFVANLLTVIQDQVRCRIAADTVPVGSPQERRKRLRTRICTELDQVGVSAKLVGYKYLMIGIQIMIEAPTQALYAAIAAQVDKPKAAVERAMRNALVLTWNGGDAEALRHYTARLSPGKKVPTVREFISYYAGRLRLEYE